MTTHALGNLNRHARRREKVFGDGKPRPMSRNMKLRLMALARVLMRPTESGKHYGRITAKHFEVFRVLLWEFHNAVTGLCFPSYKAIADKADCAPSTVAEAIKALEDAGVLTWVNRIKRVHERVVDLFGKGVHGQRSRVERTSNGYRFIEPLDVQRSKSELPSGTEGQELFSLVAHPNPAPVAIESGLEAALLRLGRALQGNGNDAAFLGERRRDGAGVRAFLERNSAIVLATQHMADGRHVISLTDKNPSSWLLHGQ
jgi:DNA-binding MarR family transcriptional regulator